MIPCLDCHQDIIAVFAPVKGFHTVKVKVHDLNLGMVLPDFIPEHIHIMAPVPLHQHQPFSVQILNSQMIFIGEAVVDGYRTANRLSGYLKTVAVSQIQHRIVKNACHHIYVLSQIFQYLPCIFRCIFKGDELKFNLRAEFVNLRSKFHQNAGRRHR